MRIYRASSQLDIYFRLHKKSMAVN